MDESSFYRLLEKHRPEFHPLLKSMNSFASIDLSRSNTEFSKTVYTDLKKFHEFIFDQRKKKGNAFLVGGYREERSMYERSTLFDTKESPRDLHLGIDIWADAGTEVYSPIDGTIHSYA